MIKMFNNKTNKPDIKYQKRITSYINMLMSDRREDDKTDICSLKILTISFTLLVVLGIKHMAFLLPYIPSSSLLLSEAESCMQESNL